MQNKQNQYIKNDLATKYLQQDINRNRYEVFDINKSNPNKYYQPQQNVSPTHIQLNKYLNQNFNLSQKIQSPPDDEDNVNYQEYSQTEQFNNLGQYSQNEQQFNINDRSGQTQIDKQDGKFNQTRNDNLINQQINKLESQYRELFLDQEKSNQKLNEQVKQLQIKNQELMQLLTQKDDRIDKLYQEINKYKQLISNESIDLLMQENQEMADQIQIFQQQLLNKQNIVNQRDLRISEIQQKPYYKSQLQQHPQNYNQIQNITYEKSVKELNNSGNFIDVQDENQQQFSQQIHSYSAQPSTRKMNKKLNLSESIQRSENRSQVSQNLSPRHNRQQSIQSRQSDMRVPTSFDQQAPSYVYKNTVVPYLGPRNKQRSRSPEKRGLEELTCPFLSGTEKRWQNSLRGDRNLQQKQQKIGSYLQSKPPIKRADQISQELRSKITNEYKKQNQKQYHNFSK